MPNVPSSAPIRLGNSVTIEVPVLLAPMAGVTDGVFRSLCREAGAGYATTEFARDEALLRGVRQQVDLTDLRIEHVLALPDVSDVPSEGRISIAVRNEMEPSSKAFSISNT